MAHANPTAGGTIVEASTSEVEQRRALRKMKRFATALLLLAAVVYLIAKINEDSATWIGYVRAIAEAAMVGALADWFAVTALFRHPLRLPIPHTAIIPRRKDQIGRSLGDFVESNFLTTDVLNERLAGAEVGRRVGDWLGQHANAERAAGAAADVMRGALEVLDDDEIQSSLEHAIEQRIRSTEVTPIVARLVDVTVDGGHHQQLLDAALGGIENFMTDNRGTLRQRLYEESPWWVPEPIDDRVFDKIDDVLTRFLRDVRSNPDHELRRSVDQRTAAFAERLRTDPELLARGEELKEELLAHPEVRRWMSSLWADAKRSMLTAADDPDSELRRRFTSSIERLGQRLATDPELQAKLDRWVAQALDYLVEHYRSEVSEIIASTVAKWDADATAEKLELQVGRDLQFIRINGTIVGGLAGLVIHAIGQLL